MFCKILPKTMKKTKFLAFMAMVLSFSPLFSQEVDWEYPIRPGNEEWAELPTTADRIKAIQVPENVLGDLSDKQLLDLILDYPFFLDYALSDDSFAGLQRSLGTLNAYKEFKSRAESLNILFDYYISLDFSQINQLKVSSEIGRFSLRVSAIELMITDLTLKRDLSIEESKQILNGISKKYDEKSVNNTELMGFGKLTTAYLAATIINNQYELKNKIQEKEELNSFVSNIRMVSNDFVDKVLNELRTYESIET